MEPMNHGHTKKLSMDPAEKLRTEQQIQSTRRDQWRQVVRIVLIPFILVWTIAFVLIHHYFPDDLARWNPFKHKPHHLTHSQLYDGNNPLAHTPGLVPWEGPLSLHLKTPNIYLTVGDASSNADLRSHLLIRTGYVLETQLFIKALVTPPPSPSKDNKHPSSVLRMAVPDNHHGIRFWMDETQPHASARLDLQLVVPTHFKGIVDVAGTWLYIEGRELAPAQFSRLALKTRRGDIRLQGTVHAEEVLAETGESGAVRCDLLAAAAVGQDFNATIRTGAGNIALTAETSQVVKDEDLAPGFWFQMASRSGGIDFAVQDRHHGQHGRGDVGGEEEARKDKERKMVPAPLMIRAESEAGYTRGRIEVGNKQPVLLLASSVSKEAIVQVSDNYSGKVTVGSPVHSDIVAKKDSKSVIQYTGFSMDEKRCLKYPAGATVPKMVGDKLTVLSLASEATVLFF
ncbi:hypothetical protein BGZ52_009441 [Haplosporangium bisporale]|nr:hypothetical protein BGZ52_009441 [Haplosporangium bisporale]